MDIKDFNNEKFDTYLGKQNLVLIIKFHPLHVDQATDCIKNARLKNIYALEDTKTYEANLDLYEVINAADLLITDYSSIYFDYLLLIDQ